MKQIQYFLNLGLLGPQFESFLEVSILNCWLILQDKLRHKKVSDHKHTVQVISHKMPLKSAVIFFHIAVWIFNNRQTFFMIVFYSLNHFCEELDCYEYSFLVSVDIICNCSTHAFEIILAKEIFYSETDDMKH